MNQEKIIDGLDLIVSSLRQYHRHEVKGMDNIPEKGRVLVVVNHSLATYDIALLFGAIYHDKGRIPRPLADRLFFKIPYVSEFMNTAGACEGTQENAESLLASEELVTVAPGGMREALRPSTERYQILWDRRKGFVKLAIKMRCPIILAVCPKADDLYHVYPNSVTAWAYRKFRVPLFLARGVGLSPIPRPVKLIHFLSEPIIPPEPKADAGELQRQVTQLHKRLVKRTQELIGEAIAYRES